MSEAPKKTWADFEWTLFHVNWHNMADHFRDPALRLDKTCVGWYSFRRAGTHEPVTPDQIRLEVQDSNAGSEVVL